MSSASSVTALFIYLSYTGTVRCFNMLPDTSAYGVDKYGCPTVSVRAEHLSDFPALMAWVNEHGYGRSTGLLKLRLHPDDRRDVEVLQKSINLLKEKFKEKKIGSKKNRKMVHAYNPDCQVFLKGAVNDHVYEYVKCKCTDKERQHFVTEAVKPSSYTSREPNCCTEALEAAGPDGLRAHIFNVLDQVSSYSDIVKKNLEELGEGAPVQHKEQGMPFVYGAGIQLNPDDPIGICNNFSLSSLNTILDKLEEKYDGIAYPYHYVGLLHTIFPWHIEDGGLYSINYLVEGKPKAWFAIPPEFYGLVDMIGSNLRLDLSHTSCRAFLADHKAVMVDPSFFASVQGVPSVPFITAIQEPGDFIVTFPFALHSGANLGFNLALAANFADIEWIELGMYAPICSCMSDSQVHLPLANLIRQFRPDLLDTYLKASCLLPPPGHPRNVLQLSSDAGEITKNGHQEKSPTASLPNESEASANSVPVAMARCQKESCEFPTLRKTVNKMGRTLYCPECNQSFVGNKMRRLQSHIELNHVGNADHLLRVVEGKYKKVAKTGLKFICKVCNKTLRGSSTHVKMHHLKEHQGIPFEGAIKA